MTPYKNIVISPNFGRDASPNTFQRANDMLNQELEILKKSNKDLEVSSLIDIHENEFC